MSVVDPWANGTVRPSVKSDGHKSLDTFLLEASAGRGHWASTPDDRGHWVAASIMPMP